MSAAQVLPMTPPPDQTDRSGRPGARLPAPETVEVPSEVVDMLLSQQREILAQQREMQSRQRETETRFDKQDLHLERQDDHLREQDNQRKLMWIKVDAIAAAVGTLQKIDERLAAIEKHHDGLAWASAFRRGLIWIGMTSLGAVIVAVITAGVSFSGAVVDWIKRL